MTAESQRLLLAALTAIGGKSWGAKFEHVLEELAASDCHELIRVLVAAGDGDQAAWRELAEAAGAAKGPALLDVVTAFVPARTDVHSN